MEKIMNDILIVPDVHGRNFWKPVLEYTGEVIFLGDYTDPYPYENLNNEDALCKFRSILIPHSGDVDPLNR